MSRILITGCSTGFGRAAAIELTKRGHEVVATARRAASIDDLDVAERLVLDVDDDESVARAVGAAGELDGLVNNAGFGLSAPVEQLPIDQARSYEAAAKRAGDAVVVEVVEGVGHFEFVDPRSSAWPVVREAVRALLELGSGTP